MFENVESQGVPMGSVVLYHNDMSVCAAKVRMALAEKKIVWDGVHLNLRAGDAQKPEYVRLNPGKVVPTLVHDGVPIIESNVIIEYLEDAWSQPALRPPSALGKARMRLWMKQLDETVHAATIAVSTCVAFRHQHLKRASLDYQNWLANLEPARRENARLAVELGMDAPQFGTALMRLRQLVADMDKALEGGPWLAGEAFSLADIAYAPYVTRLTHLGLDDMVKARPRVSDWQGRLFARPSYAESNVNWFNPKYLEIFAGQSDAAREKAKTIA